MAYFFRQSIRVQTYFFEKRDQLEDKLLDEAVVKYGIDKETIEGDKNQLAEYVYKNKDYQLFISGKIADANLVLKKYGIFDCQINDDVKETTKELDKQRDNIVPKVDSKDLLEIIANKKDKGEKLTDEEIRQLVLACDNICADIDDSILEIVEDSARNIRGDFLRPFRSTNPELREYVDTAGIKMFFEEYKELIKKYKEDLQN
ncbi:hypothetical protein J5751_05620 [bacterium]|nr:hypothetical protein [bacterium]